MTHMPQTHPTEEGDYVTLVPTYQQFSDAARGPLSLQRIESAFGLVTLSSGNRLRVRGRLSGQCFSHFGVCWDPLCGCMCDHLIGSWLELC